MWAIIKRWIQVAGGVSLFIGIGIGVLSMTPPEYTIARVCFSIAALILLAHIGWWLAVELKTSKKLLIFFMILAIAFTGSLWLISMKWISQREKNISSEKPSPAPQEPLSPEQIAKEVIKRLPKTQKPISSVPQENRFPFVNIELDRGNGYAYDSYVRNKSDVTLSKIVVLRTVNPVKNKQKRALHGFSGVSLKPYLRKEFNVLIPDERGKIERVFSDRMEYMIFTVTYRDDLDKQYKCVFEGDSSSGINMEECLDISKQQHEQLPLN